MAASLDGSVATDTAWLLRDAPQRIEDRRIVEKPERVAIDPAGGVRREAMAADQRRAACLPESWLRRIAEFGVAIEAQFGSPQDMEWAIAAGQVWILQSRPITTLAPGRAWSWEFPVTWEHADDRAMLWRLHDDDLAAVPTPLECDVSDLFFRAQVDALPVSCWPGAARQLVVNGRRYTSHVPTDLTPGDRRVGEKAKSDLVIRLRAEGKTMWDYWMPEIAQAIARLASFDATTAEAAPLADHLDDAFGAFRRHWMIHWCPWVNDAEAKPLERAFAVMTALEGRDLERSLASVVEGEETIHSRLIDGLFALAQTARAVPALASLVLLRPADALQQIEHLPEAAAFREQMAGFLKHYGAHMGMGYGSYSSLKRPTWRQDPVQVLARIAPYLPPEVEPPAIARARARVEREATVERFCAACDNPAKVAEFRRWLPVGRREATLLEEHNYWIDQVAYGQLREAISAAGRLLLTRKSIAAEDDIFWLHREEILAALRTEASDAPIALIAGRKTEAATHRHQTPPPLLGLPDARLDPRPPLKDEVTDGAPEGVSTLHGMGASAGRHRGRARIVPMTTVLPALEPGEILVALNAGPSWTPIFPALGGLVLDEGSYGQHGATTAREYRLPAVIGARNATRRIRDGAWIIIDGEAGTVEIEGVEGSGT
jgi:rifampicin phosphotransferase